MAKFHNVRRRRKFWRALSVAEWLSLLGIGLMALKAGFELAKAIIGLFQ